MSPLPSLSKYEPRPVRLALTTPDSEVSLTFQDDVDIHEFLEKCQLMALAMGFDPSSWTSAILAQAEALPSE